MQYRPSSRIHKETELKYGWMFFQSSVHRRLVAAFITQQNEAYSYMFLLWDWESEMMLITVNYSGRLEETILRRLRLNTEATGVGWLADRAASGSSVQNALRSASLTWESCRLVLRRPDFGGCMREFWNKSFSSTCNSWCLFKNFPGDSAVRAIRREKGVKVKLKWGIQLLYDASCRSSHRGEFNSSLFLTVTQLITCTLAVGLYCTPGVQNIT